MQVSVGDCSCKKSTKCKGNRGLLVNKIEWNGIYGKRGEWEE